MVGVGGFDGVGVAQPQVHVVGVGEDDGVQGVADGGPGVAGVGHDRSVSTPPALLPLPDTRLIGPQGLSPLEDPRYQSDLEHSLTAPDGYQVGSDPAVHPYGGLINDGGPSQPGRGNNCLDASLAALASFYGQPQVALPRWPDPLPDGRTDWASGEAAGIERAEAWLGGQWAPQPADMPGTPRERAERISRQYGELQDQLATGGPGSAALVVAEWLKLDRLTGQPAVDEDGNVVVHDAHAFVVVHPADADGPVWWDPQQGTVWTEPPTEYVEMTHTLWSMTVPPGEVPGDDGGRRAATDRTAGRDGESDRTASVRVRLAGEGDTVDRTAGDGGARRDGLLHHRPVGDGDGARQPADTGGHEAVRGGEAAGPDQRAPDLAASRDGGPADARLTRIRELAAHYTAADPPTRLTLRAEIGVLVDQLGLTGGTPQAYARWVQLPPDLANLLLRLTSPALAPETVLAVLGADPATLTEPQRAQQRDYRARLVHNGYVPFAPQLTEQLHRLAVDAEHGQQSLPTLPASAGQVIGLRPDQIAQLRAVDPALAARIARDGVYVDLTGRVDVSPYVLANAPQVDVGGVHPGFDLTTDAGRRALLAEDTRRAYATVTATYGQNPEVVRLLGSHRFHYLGQSRTMVLVSDALTRSILNLAPSAPVAPAPEAAPLAAGPTEIHVYADHPSLPEPEPGEVAPAYGRPVDPRSGAPAPLWNGPPRREHVAQGALGDCGMLASIGAVAGHSPQTIGHLFHPNPDGTVDVLLHESSLPGDRTAPTGRRLRLTVTPDVPVHAIMPGQAAYADQSQVGAAWASILEKALAAVDRTWTESRQVHWQQQWQGWQGRTDPHRAAPLGYARMNPGSTPDLWAELLTQLTGEPARTGRFPIAPGSEPTAEATLARLLAQGNPVIASTRPPDRYLHLPNGTPPYGLYAGHAYEVVAAQGGHVWLRNPWNHGHPQPIPVRAFLDLMSRDYAHLDRAPVVPPPPPLPPVAEQASRPGESMAQARVGGSAGVASTALTAAGPGRTVVDRGGAYFVYYVDRDPAGELVQLVAVEVGPDGQQRSTGWSADRATPGAGAVAPLAAGAERLPVSRAEAEQVARSEWGFELPDEPTLHEMLGG
ncbi:toxin glutamine deamidase domain-containing protein [Solwaraspora sp. WMMA2056]|uniref:toxin glutamine deamidase domain-containing protein n=1 Tax=Solwaraspora sp. WMMA2056 TaxID=3015161 RepID=UPI00338D3A8C